MEKERSSLVCTKNLGVFLGDIAHKSAFNYSQYISDQEFQGGVLGTSARSLYCRARRAVGTKRTGKYFAEVLLG
jgi:hypothetical protein